MITYHNALRLEPHYRREMFTAGLETLGLSVGDPHRADVLLIWNRYGMHEAWADAAEARGARVIVAENATWGNEFHGRQWFSIWNRFHNRADSIRDGGPARWDALRVPLEPWRPTGGEIVGLGQRGIGPRGTPQNYRPANVDRVRPHPGRTVPAVPLEVDLARASQVATWGSGAAVKALMMGVRVRSHMPGWCGSQDNTDAGRLAMLQRLAWAQWTHDEIRAGDPFRWLLTPDKMTGSICSSASAIERNG